MSGGGDINNQTARLNAIESYLKEIHKELHLISQSMDTLQEKLNKLIEEKRKD